MMQSLLKFIKMLKRFLVLSIKDKIIIFKAFLLCGIFRGAMLLIPFKKFKNYIGILNEESDDKLSEDKYEEALNIGRLVNMAANHTPWESKCLVRALTAQYLLAHKNIDSTLYLGVGKDPCVCDDKSTRNSTSSIVDNMVAHSWIRCGALYVTGGNGKNYGIVARFKKEGIRNK